LATKKTPLEIRDLKSDLEVYVQNRLDRRGDINDLSLALRPTRVRQHYRDDRVTK